MARPQHMGGGRPALWSRRVERYASDGERVSYYVWVKCGEDCWVGRATLKGGRLVLVHAGRCDSRQRSEMARRGFNLNVAGGQVKACQAARRAVFREARLMGDGWALVPSGNGWYDRTAAFGAP